MASILSLIFGGGRHKGTIHTARSRSQLRERLPVAVRKEKVDAATVILMSKSLSAEHHCQQSCWVQTAAFTLTSGQIILQICHVACHHHSPLSIIKRNPMRLWPLCTEFLSQLLDDSVPANFVFPSDSHAVVWCFLLRSFKPGYWVTSHSHRPHLQLGFFFHRGKQTAAVSTGPGPEKKKSTSSQVDTSASGLPSNWELAL